MADEETKPADAAEEKPAEEAAPEVKASEEAESTPPAAKEEEAAPAKEEAAPAKEEAAPAKEEAAPAKEEAAPAKGEAAPAKEEKAAPASAAKEGDAAPASAAKEEESAPAQKEEPARAPKEEKKERTAADVLLELEGGEEATKPKVLKAKGSKNIHTGIVHIRATFNNTSITITDQKGNVIGWSTSGKMGFRGSRKSTAYAAQVVSQDACRQAMSHGLKEAEVRVKGPGAGRESAVRAVQNMGIEILGIRDVTPVPHNGCRPPKARRV